MKATADTTNWQKTEHYLRLIGRRKKEDKQKNVTAPNTIDHLLNTEHRHSSSKYDELGINVS